jgi:hypothetical protein
MTCASADFFHLTPTTQLNLGLEHLLLLLRVSYTAGNGVYLSIYLSIYLSVRSRFYERKLSPCRAAAAAPRRETD